MKLIRLLFKIPAIPLALGFWTLKWIGMFIVSMSGWIFYMLASGLFTLGIVFKLFGVAEWSEILSLWGVSFVIFVIPFIAGTITALFGAASTFLRVFIFS